jgi:hypothetical protein
MRASVPEVLHHCPARYKEPSRNRGTCTNGRGFADRLRLTSAVFGAQANSRFLVTSLLGMTKLFASCRHSQTARFGSLNDKMGLLAAEILRWLALLGTTAIERICNLQHCKQGSYGFTPAGRRYLPRLECRESLRHRCSGVFAVPAERPRSCPRSCRRLRQGSKRPASGL